MPSVRNRGRWCGCWGKSEPPEITYCVVDQEGTLNLLAITPTLPMPGEEELNAKFGELLDELDLTAPNREAMLSLPPEKKWQIYCSKKKATDEECSGFDLPENYAEKVRYYGKLTFPAQDDEEVKNWTKFFDGLKTALRTQPNSFVISFIDNDGLSALIGFLSQMDYRTAESSIHTSVIGCIKALMNNSTGRAHVLAHPTSINIIAQSLSAENIRTKVPVLEILGAVCLVPGGHKKVLEAMLHYQKHACERTRFQSIINDLDRSTGIYRDEVNLKTAIMSFVNAVLSYGPGKTNLEFRVHLRYEFLMLGIQPVIDKLRSYGNETLERHLDFFEMVRNEDEKEVARKYEQVHVDTKSATSMFEVLRKKTSHTAAYPHLLSMLHHLLLLPLDCNSCSQHWLMLDRILQQVVLQSEQGEDCDVSILDINVNHIVQLLATEEELVSAKDRAEDLEKDNIDLATSLTKKEQECDIRTQEKEDLELCVERLKERLEKESLSHMETKQKMFELEHRMSELGRQMVSERARGQQNGVGDPQTDLSFVSKFPSFTPSSITSIPPPPPPSGLMNMGVPPPPPPGGSLPSSGVLTLQANKSKSVPQPSNPLKSFNWSKLNESKVQGTLWMELDETSVYKVMDLQEVDKLFSAYQKNGLHADGSAEDLRTLGRNTKKVLSVIDSRRAQNCTILLSKLKMSNEELFKAILSMDHKDCLPHDMVEQLLKFTPSSEERALLEEHNADIDQMDRADGFLYEISKIPHYEQRLRTLFYKKKMLERIAEYKPKIQSVLEASKEVQRSKKLKRLLELVLAFGNYMNRGQRGNAIGFKLSSLNRIADTKSSTSKNLTLLHYLIETVEKNFRDVIKIDEDLTNAKRAARVNMSELEKDMTALRTGLQEVERELEWHRSRDPTPGDRYIPVMKEFLASASYKLSELEDAFQEMKSRYEKTVRLFGEDPAITQPDEFFGTFDAFITAFNEAKQDNDNIKKRQEEEVKRAQQEAELKRRTLDRKATREGFLDKAKAAVGARNGVNVNGSVNPSDSGEFDDLISALRTGDVFGEDMAKFKRNRRRVGQSPGNSSPPRNSVNGGLHVNGFSRDTGRERVLVMEEKAN